MAIKPVRLVKCASGSQPEYETISVTSTSIDGDLLVKTNNVGIVCASAGTVVSYLTQAAGSATVPGITASNSNVVKVRPQDTYEMNMFVLGAAESSVVANDLDGQSDFGITFVTVSSVAAWVIDRINTTQKVVRLIENLEGVSAQYPRCRVQFLPAALTFA